MSWTKQLWKNIASSWKQYKYRFVPWLAFNIQESSPRLVPLTTEDKIIADHIVENTLASLFACFQSNHSSLLLPENEHEDNLQSMFEMLGFTIERRQSNVTDGGVGVFVSSGHVRKGSIVAMYPGLVYQPTEPVLLVSLKNQFLFRCADGIYIDGKDQGLSKRMYISCARRDCAVYGQDTYDTSWLGQSPVNPLAVGQYINNQSNECPANVAYQEFDVPDRFPQNLLKYIPNIQAQMFQQDMDSDSNLFNRLLRVVILVSLRDINAGEELFSTYYTIIQKT